MAWQASALQTPITPPAGLPMGGYGTVAGPRMASGTFSELYARAVVLRDSGTPYVIVSADLLGWPHGTAEAIRSQVTAATGLPAAHLMLLGTHTHNGPALPGSPDPWRAYALGDPTAIENYELDLINTVVQLVVNALSVAPTSVTVDYKTTTLTASTNREGLAYTETQVPVLVARKTDGQPLAVLFGYGSHPVAAGWQTQWDGDYPAAAAAAIEAVFPGAVAAFLPGAAGDQNPTGPAGWALRTSLGAKLADVVVSAAVAPGRALTSITAARLQNTSLPLDIDPTPGNLAAVRDCFATRAANGTAAAWDRRHAQASVDAIDAGDTFPTALTLPMQVFKFGGATPLSLAFVGGEPVSGYAVYFRSVYGADKLWFGGYGNGLLTYLPSNELLPPNRTGGSYAGGWNTDFPGIGGGAMCIYGPIAHFLAGNSGVEGALINGVAALLA
jgi:hypothetical protein